jgi:nickel-dependent lactate racemase
MAGKIRNRYYQDALKNPVNSPKLTSLAASKKKIVIITSDHTRAVPSALTLPVLLEEIRSGNPDADITILVATGLHRGMTEEEMKNRFGEDIFRKEKIINHDAFDKTCFET